MIAAEYLLSVKERFASYKPLGKTKATIGSLQISIVELWCIYRFRVICYRFPITRTCVCLAL